MAEETVTFTTPGGSQVTCSKELAERLGYKPPAKKATPRKSASSRSTDDD